MSLSAAQAYEVAQMRSRNGDEERARVMAYVQRKIATAASLGHRDAMCTIPSYIPDTLQYDMPEMVEAVILALNALGYYVRLLHFPSLYISWRYVGATTREQPNTL